MGNLPDIKLKAWKRGDGISAADLNGNFTLLADQVSLAMHTALTPDPASVANEVSIARHDERIDALERLTALHARQRNEREYAPLSYVGATLIRMQQLQDRFEETVSRLEAALTRAQALHDGQERRLARIEQQPEPATLEDHRALAESHADLKLKEHMLLAQTIALRSELMGLRDLATAKDRVANRLEFAPLSYIGGILQRLQALEQQKRLGEEAQP